MAVYFAAVGRHGEPYVIGAATFGKACDFAASRAFWATAGPFYQWRPAYERCLDLAERCPPPVVCHNSPKVSQNAACVSCVTHNA